MQGVYLLKPERSYAIGFHRTVQGQLLAAVLLCSPPLLFKLLLPDSHRGGSRC